MGFNKVYKTLQEVFPQVDARALRAVAIEHSKDADAAVEAVLLEIIPFFTERSMPNTSSTRSTVVEESLQALPGAIAIDQTAADCASVKAAAGSIDGQDGDAANSGYQDVFVDANDGSIQPLCETLNEGDGLVAESTMCGIVLENIMQLNTDNRSHDEAVQLARKVGVDASQVEVSVELETDKTILDGKNPASRIQLESDTDPCQALGTPKGKDAGVGNVLSEWADSSGLETETATDKDSDRKKNSGDDKTCIVGPSSFIAHDLTVSLPENKLSLLQELDGTLPNNTTSKMESTSIVVGNDDESSLNGSMSQSSKIQMIDALAKIIVEARNNKKMLFSAMDSVISLMREVEIKEKDSEQAQVEAALGGKDILMKSEELKEMLKQAEEINSMHAGEVYGEKAVLATELRELEARALSLSVERDKYLAVLDEMQQTLEVRLADAQNVIKSAEQEKLEKENGAMKSLTELELIMEKVLQESKSLNQQAEDNAKLREFLVDRGRIVDTLQGEISVICQDVRLLKEKFDEHIPFSKSLSSSQTTCILASSGSSSKSLVPDQVESLPEVGVAPMDTQKMKGVISCSTEPLDDGKVLSDDEWEIFDVLP